MKRSAPLKRKTRMKPMSDKRKAQSAIYSKLRKAFLTEHPRCQVDGCKRASRDVHHTARRGANYLAVETFLAVCRPCHDFIETNGNWAREKGYLV